ncbi:biopolymer transport protein TolR [Tibeticola sediminis]|uniref:Biopolymer transport protein TolR n=1 Tax=Tibeticola sediminis TaxID=1917811 RepID=A0A3N4UHQ3_9BURK|nr:biopolymer transporter ExbD [Tibeticola sediminis]RPE66821.1 biopolymer transport protein TolR [Tibeticola sediminis]
MFGRFESRPVAAPFSEINVTPMVDVMLVLVVILIVTAPLLGSALQLELPKAEGTRTHAATASALAVSIDPLGQLYLDDLPVEADALRARLAAKAAQDPATELRLRADGAVPYARVAEVIGIAQAAGLSRIAFVASPAGEVAPPPTR